MQYLNKLAQLTLSQPLWRSVHLGAAWRDRHGLMLARHPLTVRKRWPYPLLYRNRGSCVSVYYSYTANRNIDKPFLSSNYKNLQDTILVFHLSTATEHGSWILFYLWSTMKTIDQCRQLAQTSDHSAQRVAQLSEKLTFRSGPLPTVLSPSGRSIVSPVWSLTR